MSERELMLYSTAFSGSPSRCTLPPPPPTAAAAAAAVSVSHELMYNTTTVVGSARR